MSEGKTLILTHFQDGTASESSVEEEIEPKLKYVRLSNDLQSIFIKSTATCIAVHRKVYFFTARKRDFFA